VPLGVVDPLDVTLPEPTTLARGDILAVISDGIFEAMNADNRQFGTDRVCEIITTHRDETPDDIITHLRAAVEAHTNAAPAADDKTGIILKAV
jgi:sigma-B regulation protein RsbU (phosphoserine phosphatase)